MVIRVLPASKGGIYSNAGGSNYLVNYLEHEAREENQEDKAIFFDQSREGITSEEVQKRIDANVKGLQKDKPRFHSIVVAPSKEELRHLNDDPEKLKSYTRQVMENYAVNFSDKRKRPIKSDDLVWFATIHRSRHYSGLDDAVQTGTAKPRQQKEGEQTHIHIVVSARDKTMSRSLHPDAGKSRFNYQDWLHKNYTDFERTFSYKQTVSESQHRERLEKQVNRLSRGGIELDQEKMESIGRYYGYSSAFWKGMGQVERGMKQGNIFTANQAYDRLKNVAELATNSARPVPSHRAIQAFVETPGTNAVHTPVQARSNAEMDSSHSSIPNAKQELVPKKPGVVQATNDNQEYTKQKIAGLTRTDLSALLKALTFESVPQTGEQARNQDDDYRRKLKRRR